jgi:hypothetical protein
MDDGKTLLDSSSLNYLENLINQAANANNHLHLNSQLLTIIKDLFVNYNYHQRKTNSPNPLNKYGKKCFSQTDEDGITYEIIRRLDIKRGNFAEFGVGNGLENNTLLLSSLGWKGFWVGGEDLVFESPENENFCYIKDWITLENILKIIKETKEKIKINDLDVISLDLDGNDFHFCKEILKNKIFPKLFIVEYNAKFFPPIEFIMKYDQFHSWQLDDHYGASLMSFYKLFKEFDYKLVCCNSHTGANAFFVQNKFANKFKDVPSEIKNIFMEPNFELACKYGHFSSVKVVENIINR